MTGLGGNPFPTPPPEKGMEPEVRGTPPLVNIQTENITFPRTLYKGRNDEQFITRVCQKPLQKRLNASKFCDFLELS